MTTKEAPTTVLGLRAPQQKLGTESMSNQTDRIMFRSILIPLQEKPPQKD